MTPQASLHEQYLGLKRTQPIVPPQQERGLYQKYLESKEKREPIPVEEARPADWRKELPGAIKETLGELPAAQMVKKEYWTQAAENLAEQAGQFIQAETTGRAKRWGRTLPGLMTFGLAPELMPEKMAAPISEMGRGARRGAIDFALFLPKTALNLAKDPVKTIRDEPLAVILLAGMAGKGVTAKWRAKARTGQPITKQNMAEAINKIPEKIITKKQKTEIKANLPEQMESPFGKLEPTTPAQKIMIALKEAKPLRRKQEALYTAERARRFAEARETGRRIKGERGFYAEKATLKGELPKVEFEPIRNKLTQTDIETMFKEVTDSPSLTYLETLPAREGLAKLFGEYGGKVPTTNELILLNRVFGKEFTQAIMTKRGRWEKIRGGLIEGANVPRALMASYDLSFGLRQGIFLAARYPKEFTKAFAAQFKLFGSEKTFKTLKEEIRSRPTYELMTRGRRKLALTEMDSALSLREEAFMGAAWGEKIPIVGLGVRASARAYTGFANKLRADIFDSMIKSAEKTGRNPWKEPQLVDSIIDFVNAGSGRGSLKMLEKAAVNLNTVVFSPRLIASRLNLLNPRFYYKLDPFVRKQALQSLFAFTGMTATVLGLAKLGGLEVGLDPRSADFAKIKIGNTRLDIMGGFQQYIRTAAQLMSGRVVSTTTGRVTKLGEGYKPATRATVAMRGLEYKLAPIASFAVSLFRGRTTFGEPIDVPEEVAKRFVPMVIQDVIDLAKDDPDLLPIVIPGFFGVGIQTYGARKKEGVVY